MEAPPAEEALSVAPAAAADITPATDAALQAELAAETERQIDA